MGNSTTKEINERKLLVKNRLLESQVKQFDHVDPVIKNAIEDVKKNHKYTNLILSGGGIKGLAYVGVLEYLHNNRYLSNIKNIACSSVGSIFAVLYAIGYSIPEIKQIAETMDFPKLIGTDESLISDIFHVATEYGANNGQHLINTITNLIEKRTGNKNYTLEQLWKEKGINLVITGTDLNTEKTIYFWHGTYPKMPLRLLVRISCSVPGVFSPVIFDGHYLVDGGLLDNTPIHVFDGDTPSDPRAQQNMAPVNPHTLSIMLIDDLNPKGTAIEQGDVGLQARSNKNNFVNKINSIEDYYNAITNAMIDSGVQRYVKPSYWLRTVPVHVPAYPIYHFSLTRSQTKDMFLYGYESTKEFFH
jgi:NTE family protein